MSRSVHTRPLWIRAASRVRDPFAPRGQGDERIERARRRELGAQGLVPVVEHEFVPGRDGQRPRLVVQTPRSGHVHCVSKGDVESVLDQLGPAFFYGLRSVELARGASDELTFGRLVAIGRILIFDVPAPPWRIRLAVEDASRLVQSGAAVERNERGVLDVSWPGDSLRAFGVDVLLHELGHHHLQHHRGKRPVRVARTRDHEAHAELFAERARRILGGDA